MLDQTYQEYKKLILKFLKFEWISTHQIALAIKKHDTNVSVALEKLFQEELVERQETGAATRIILWRKKNGE